MKLLLITTALIIAPVAHPSTTPANAHAEHGTTNHADHTTPSPSQGSPGADPHAEHDMKSGCCEKGGEGTMDCCEKMKSECKMGCCERKGSSGDRSR